MQETTKDPIEQKILQGERQISELEKQASVLTEIQYIPGQENKAAYLPSLESSKTRGVIFKQAF